MTQSELTKRLLAMPVGPAVPAKPVNPEKDFTRQLEVSGDSAEVIVRGPDGEVDESLAAEYLVRNGEDPAHWEPTGFRTSEWTMANGELGVSKRFTYRRIAGQRPLGLELDMDYLVRRIKRHKPRANRPDGDFGAIVALGDMQFGKPDGDGVDGTVDRTIDYINRAADRIEALRKQYNIGHVHVCFLGDHIEGFVSQGGANAARTLLTLTEQTRLTRRVMYHAAETFAPLAERVSMVAVPGNHGEPQRFMGSGVIRYDDSHDTEALIAVQEGLSYNQDAYGHVEFYVPDNDELTVVTEVAGTIVGHVHGHAFRPGKHMDWWRGQAFHANGLHQAQLLLAGHLHHLLIEDDGPRRFLQVPALESESTWYRHLKGTVGNPGLVLALTSNGQTNQIEVIQ